MTQLTNHTSHPCPKCGCSLTTDGRTITDNCWHEVTSCPVCLTPLTVYRGVIVLDVPQRAHLQPADRQ